MVDVVSRGAGLMCDWMKRIGRGVFPFPMGTSAEVYRDRALKDEIYAKLEAALEDATRTSSLDEIKLFCEYAKRYVSEQQERSSSVISRSQTYLVSQTLVGALLALVTALMGHSDMIDGWKMWLLIAILGYSIIQILLLTVNALRATAGVSVEYPGVTPLIRWVPEGQRLLEKNMALKLIKTYWDLDISNSWRISHFGLAQACLRNIIIALTSLVVILVMVMIWSTPAPHGPLLVHGL